MEDVAVGSVSRYGSLTGTVHLKGSPSRNPFKEPLKEPYMELLWRGTVQFFRACQRQMQLQRASKLCGEAVEFIFLDGRQRVTAVQLVFGYGSALRVP